MLQRVFPGLALACLALPLSPRAAAAQEEMPNGRLLTLGTSLGLSVADNPDLEPDGGETRSDATLRLDAAYTEATPLSQLRVSGDLGLRASGGNGGDDDPLTLDSPGIALSYGRQSRDAAFSVDASARQSEVSTLEPFDGTLEDLLELEDLDELRGEGTRLRFSLDTELELRRRAPFGITLSAGVTGLRYSGVPASSTLEDETRFRTGIGLRFDLSPITRATTDLGYVAYDGESDRPDRVSLDLGLSQERPTGRIGVSMSLSETPDGVRTGLFATRSLTLPGEAGSLTGRLGATLGASGELYPTGGLTVSLDAPVGAVGLDLSRRVVSSSEDEERVLTRLTANYGRALTPLWDFGLDLSYVQSDAATGNGTDTYGSVDLGLSRSLTEDWAISLEAQHRFEDDADSARASGSTLSISLNRVTRLTF